MRVPATALSVIFILISAFSFCVVSKSKQDSFEMEKSDGKLQQQNDNRPICKLKKKKSDINYPSLKTCTVYTRNSCCTS